MTNQISFGTKEMGLALKEDKGDFRLKASICSLGKEPMNTLWIEQDFLRSL